MSEIRIAVFGAGGVGKSALATMFAQGKFFTKYDPTIEDSYQKLCTVAGETYKVEVLDMAGSGVVGVNCFFRV